MRDSSKQGPVTGHTTQDSHMMQLV